MADNLTSRKVHTSQQGNGLELWGVITDLMDCVAAGRGEGEKQALWAPRGIQQDETLTQQYRAWVDFYRSWFGKRNYPLAQAFLNTDRGRTLLPGDFLYGTALIVIYQHQSVRVLHLLNSSRFLYFFTDPRFTTALQLRYATGGDAIDQVWKSLAGNNRHDLGLELQQLAQKYSILASKHLEVPGQHLVDWDNLSTSRSRDRFIREWGTLVERYADWANNAVGGAERAIDEPAVFGQFLLLDFFDLAYLLQLRKRRHALQAWVKSASTKALEQAGFLFGANSDDRDFFELLCPAWAPSGLIKSVLAFPIASQAFYEPEMGVDDVFFVAFLAKEHDFTTAVPEVEGLRLIVNLMSAASLNELRRLFVVDEARHSAVAAIMGRNMSHNIGSHVLHWLVQKDRDLAQIRGKHGGGDEEHERAHFLTYLRERMDYIATVTRRVTWWYTTGSADSLIAPFIDHEEGRDRPPFDALLKTIAKSDSIGKVSMQAAESANGDSRRKAFRRMNLAIPHGTAGRQAFYTILENIVRNAAKYQQESIAHKELVVMVDFRESDEFPDLVEVVIRENATRYSEETMRAIEDALKDSFTDPHGVAQMRQLGLKEMRISAAFLRGIDPSMADEIQDPDLIHVRDEGGWLAHVFYLRKSRDVLLVTAWGREISEAARRRLETLGVGFAPPAELVRDAEPTATVSAYRFRFILQNVDFDWDRWSEQTKGSWRWPLRTLREAGSAFMQGGIAADQGSTDRIRKLVDSLRENSDEAKERSIARDLKIEVYDAWLTHWHGENSALRLVVYDPARPWLAKLQEEDPKQFVVDQERNPFCKDSSDKIPDFSDRVTAAFAHHGVPEKAYPALSNQLIYVEGYSGGTTTAQLLRHSPGFEAEEFLVRELREAALTNLLIIDERIAGGQPPTMRTRQERYCRGIELIGAEFLQMVDKGEVGGSAIKVELPEVKWPKHWFRREHPFMYLTIHYSLIEKTAKKVGMKTAVCAELLVKFFRTKATFVFIHSGRGLPDLPPGVRFIDYSSLESWFREGKRRLIIGFGGL